MKPDRDTERHRTSEHTDRTTLTGVLAVNDPGGWVWIRAIAPWMAIFSGLLAVGTIAYVLLEGWRPLDALFMAVITLTTIGFGEVHPLSDAGRVFTIVYILAGLGVASRGLSEIARYVADGTLTEELRARRARREIQHMRSHYVVVGYGRLGREIVADLHHHGAHVVVIDVEPTIQTPDGVTLVAGDATQDETLKAAGIDHARGIAIATPSDAVNVYLTLTARQLNPKLTIATRCEEEAAASRARRAGADVVLMPYHLGGARLAQSLLRPGTSTFVEHATQRHFDDLLLEDLVVTPDSGLVGTLNELDLRGRFGVMVVAVQRRGNDRLVEAEPGTRVDVGDTLVIVGLPHKVRALARSREQA